MIDIFKILIRGKVLIKKSFEVYYFKNKFLELN